MKKSLCAGISRRADVYGSQPALRMPCPLTDSMRSARHTLLNPSGTPVTHDYSRRWWLVEASSSPGTLG